MINRKFSISKIQDAKTIANGGRVGSKFQNVFNFGNRQVSYFTPKVGTNKINILPYEIKTNNHPLVRNGSVKLGDPDCQDFYYPLKIHRWFGPLKAHVICPTQFGQPCPICEKEKQLYEQNDPNYKNYKPAKRIFYNVEDLNEPGHVKIFETSEFLFQKELLDEASQGNDEGTINFADCDNGKTVRFRASETQLDSNKYLEFKSFGFEDRDPIPDSLLEQCVSFDQYINTYTYDEILSIMEGELPSGESGSSQQSAPTQQAAPVQQQAAPAQPAPQRVEVQQMSSVSNLADQASQPAAPTQQTAPVQSAPAANGGLVCPFGYVCGKDTDDKPECGTCQLWDKCIELS